MNTLKFACLIILLLSWLQIEYGGDSQHLLLSMANRSSLDLNNNQDTKENSPINTVHTIKTTNFPNGFNGIDRTDIIDADHSNELYCLALNIYFEARGESELGQKAVGHVVMNRVVNTKFPDSVCKVVRQGGDRKLNRCQFSWWCDGRSDIPTNLASWHQSIRVAREIYFGKSSDPTQGALWYHAEYAHPYWKKAFLRGPKIGKHIFYRNRRPVISADRDDKDSANT